MIRAATPAGRRIMMELLQSPEAPCSARALAARTGLSPAVANDVLRFLRFHGAIASSGAKAVRWRRLAGLASQLRLADIVPSRIVKADVGAEEAYHRLRQHGIPAVLCFTTAANRWAYFEPDPAVHITVPMRKAASGVLALQEGDGSRTKGALEIHLYEDDLESLDTEDLGGLRLTSRLQTWLDLQQFPHAGAHAAFFEQIVARLHPEATR